MFAQRKQIIPQGQNWERLLSPDPGPGAGNAHVCFVYSAVDSGSR